MSFMECAEGRGLRGPAPGAAGSTAIVDDPSVAALSGAERAAFQRDGFVLPRLTVGGRHIAAIAAAAVVLVRAAGPAAARPMHGPHRARAGADHNPLLP